MPTSSADPPDSVTVPIRRRADGKLTLLDEPPPPPRAAPAPSPVTLVAPPPVAPPRPQPVVEARACPRCRAPLIDPDSLALCPQCGWCRALEEAACLASPRAGQAERPALLGSIEFLELLCKLPAWIWGLLGGLTVAAVVAVAADSLLPARGLPRALWTTGQIGFGLGLVVAAQAWALVLLAPADDRLGARDLFLPGRLWNLTLKRLPATKGSVSLAAWGVALAAAAAWVGGLSYWLPVGK